MTHLVTRLKTDSYFRRNARRSGSGIHSGIYILIIFDFLNVTYLSHVVPRDVEEWGDEDDRENERARIFLIRTLIAYVNRAARLRGD